MCNFYSLRFQNNEYIPLIRKGVKIMLEGNIAYLNGVCMYKCVGEPLVRESSDIDLDKLFASYPDKTPWIAKENNNDFYLYKGSIDQSSLNLGFDIDKDTVYLSIELLTSGHVSVNKGRVITRLFAEDKQTCVVELKKDTNIIIEQEKMLTILEWNGEKFICR